MTQKRWAVGVDIGGTKVAVAQIDEEGTILQRRLFPTIQQDGPAGIEANIIAAVNDFRQNAKTSPIGIGIGMAGQVDSETGIVHFAPNLENWHEIPLKEQLEKQVGCDVYLTNDVRAATIGEWYHGAGKGCDNFVCLFIGTGIGGGIVTDGQLLHGSSNTAGELGHMIVKFDGPECSCGNRGCVESFAGGWAIAKHAHESSTFAPEVTAKEVIEAYHAKDPRAIPIINSARQALIVGGISIVHAFNPQRLIIGGGIAYGLPQIVDWMSKGIQEKAFPSSLKRFEVCASHLKQDAGLVGAAAMMLHLKDEK